MASQGRRLSDRILDAFELACEQDDAEVAEGLYKTLEIVLTRYGGAGKADGRKNVDFIREASGRLEKLRADRRAA
jgi:hypothetical protein